MSVSVFDCDKSRQMLPGAVGELEALLACPGGNECQRVVIICHPHPLYGGSMQNKVVHTLSKSMLALGCRSVRFNFRGVGNSEGSYDNAVGEVDDLQAVIDWVKQVEPESEIWLAGFSFGAYVALKSAQHNDIKQLITVAPPVSIFDFTSVNRPDCDWLLIQGMQDEVVDADAVITWSQQFADINTITFPDSGHFFHGKLNQLDQALQSALSPGC